MSYFQSIQVWLETPRFIEKLFLKKPTPFIVLKTYCFETFIVLKLCWWAPRAQDDVPNASQMSPRPGCKNCWWYCDLWLSSSQRILVTHNEITWQSIYSVSLCYCTLYNAIWAFSAKHGLLLPYNPFHLSLLASGCWPVRYRWRFPK